MVFQFFVRDGEEIFLFIYFFPVKMQLFLRSICVHVYIIKYNLTSDRISALLYIYYKQRLSGGSGKTLLN